MLLDHALHFQIVTERNLMEEATSFGKVFLRDVHVVRRRRGGGLFGEEVVLFVVMYHVVPDGWRIFVHVIVGR